VRGVELLADLIVEGLHEAFGRHGAEAYLQQLADVRRGLGGEPPAAI
jgi:hypothetical protein